MIVVLRGFQLLRPPPRHHHQCISHHPTSHCGVRPLLTGQVDFCHSTIIPVADNQSHPFNMYVCSSRQPATVIHIDRPPHSGPHDQLERQPIREYLVAMEFEPCWPFACSIWDIKKCEKGRLCISTITVGMDHINNICNMDCGYTQYALQGYGLEGSVCRQC